MHRTYKGDWVEYESISNYFFSHCIRDFRISSVFLLARLYGSCKYENLCHKFYIHLCYLTHSCMVPSILLTLTLLFFFFLPCQSDMILYVFLVTYYPLIFVKKKVFYCFLCCSCEQRLPFSLNFNIFCSPCPLSSLIRLDYLIF